jgi:hypothetical protein
VADYNDPTTYTGPTPGAGSYGILQAQAEKSYGDAVSQIATQRTSFLGQQGLTGNYDPTSGNFTGFDVDANNQSGAYQQMENQNAGQAQADDAAIGSMGFGGGLATQQHEAANRQYSANAANWASNAGMGFDALSQKDIAAKQQTGDTLYNGLVDNIQNAIANQTFNPADYTNVSIPGYGDLSSDDIGAIATGLGYKTPGTTTDTSGSGPLGGGGSGTTGQYAGHPLLNAYNKAHPNHQMTLAQWKNRNR